MIKTLPPVRANVGLEAIYRKKLNAMIDAMHRSIAYFILAQLRSDPPELHGVDPADGPLALDESPAAGLRDAIKKLAKRWQSNFDDGAEDLAKYFAKAAHKRSDVQLQAILKKAGFSVKFQMTRAMNDVFRASVAENVGLIKSIPQQYLTRVNTMVMQTVSQGGDFGQLTKDLQKQYAITKKRAVLISRDQNNKITANFTSARQRELGIDRAVWMHSGGGKSPRPSHVAAGKRKQVYSVEDGWYDPDAYGKGKGAWVRPGELINCRCVSLSVIPGFY